MTSNTKLILAAAMTGLLAGSAARASTSTSAPVRTAQQQSITSAAKGASLDTKLAAKPGVLLADDTKGKHDCKAKNDCKGEGGCKSGDNGCKGKNSCKGKGGCNTNKGADKLV